MEIYRLTNSGLQKVNQGENNITVYLSGKPLSGSYNQLPANKGGGKAMFFYRGNCSGAKPYRFRDIEKAMDSFKNVRWERNGEKENAKVFKNGNLFIGNIINDKFVSVDKPTRLLL